MIYVVSKIQGLDSHRLSGERSSEGMATAIPPGKPLTPGLPPWQARFCCFVSLCSCGKHRALYWVPLQHRFHSCCFTLQSNLCASHLLPQGPMRLNLPEQLLWRSLGPCWREFVRQYYTLLNQDPDTRHRFYGRTSYVHRGLESNGKPANAVYRQKEAHRKVMSENFTNSHTKICHVDAQATLNDGVVVKVIGSLSNNNKALGRFMQTFMFAPEGSVASKFYAHNDMFTMTPR